MYVAAMDTGSSVWMILAAKMNTTIFENASGVDRVQASINNLEVPFYSNGYSWRQASTQFMSGCRHRGHEEVSIETSLRR
jgi:hypothetical protein